MQVLFALNRQYLLNEKGAVQRADGLSIRPSGVAERIQAAFAYLALPEQYAAALDTLAELVAETGRHVD
jgi:hypothetical protein